MFRSVSIYTHVLPSTADKFRHFFYIVVDNTFAAIISTTTKSGKD
jgi:hypothetical protein